MSDRIAALVERYGAVELAVAPFAVLLALLFALLADKDGGFAPTVWMPVALFATLLLAVAIWQGRIPTRGPAAASLALLAAFVLLMGASIAWAQVRGDAWAGADRALFYLVLFTLCVVLPWRHGTAVLALGGFATAVTAVGLWQFLRVAHDPAGHRDFFVVGRLATPISYPNANCALFLMAALPLLVLASRKEVPLLARGVFLASAGIAGELAIACQSRLSILAVPLALLLMLAFSGSRARLVFTAVPVFLAVALSARTILHLYDAVSAGPGTAALGDARRALLATGVALLLVGWAGAAFDQRVSLARRGRLIFELAAGALVLAAVVAGAVAAHRVVPHPVAFVHQQWRGFITGGDYNDATSSHFTSVGTNRYAIWRVAVHEFTGSPVGGVGVDNFPPDYLRERANASEDPLFPHSLPLMVLSQTGVIGSLLFVGFLVAVGLALARSVGRRTPDAVLAVACVLPFVYFALHGSGDWFWEIPALGAPAVAFLGVAVGLAGREVRRASVPPWLVGAATLVALVVVALPWLSARETSLAARNWPQGLSLAYDRVNLASDLNPLSDQPADTEGLIAARAGDPRRARDAFRKAISRNAVNWYSRLELAVMESQLGDPAAASAAIDDALRLNPLEPLLKTVKQRFDAGKTVDQSYVDDVLQAEEQATVGAR